MQTGDGGWVTILIQDRDPAARTEGECPGRAFSAGL
jgi:hypothetical protein